MSKLPNPVGSAIFTAFFVLFAQMGVYSQYVDAVITIDPASAKVSVTGKLSSERRAARSLSFLTSAVGVPNLGNRIADVKLTNSAGATVSSRAFNPAEYVADSDFVGFSYKVDLTPAGDVRAAAHASWIGGEEGILFLDDLLPFPGAADGKAARLAILLPADWQLIGIPERGRATAINDIDRSVIALGKNIRRITVPGGNSAWTLAVSGNWLFDDTEAARLATEVREHYSKVFGGSLAPDAVLILFPTPQADVRKGTWEAETRGSTVVITSSDMPFKTQSVQRLHEQLRHEVFHLWIPNGVNLSGKYDWFYEGFALYQSLRAGVALNRIRFEDFLDTLSRARTIERSENPRRSLIDASRERFSGSETILYARGMVAAFLCDLVLLSGSNGKASVETLLRRAYERHRSPAAAADGNTAIMQLFDGDPALRSIAEDHIRGAKPIDWSAITASAGLEDTGGTSVSVLRIKAKPTGKQKAVLEKLGYNNWRKLTLR